MSDISDDIYEIFAKKVREKCRLIERYPSLVGTKDVYDCRDYLVVLDNLPFAKEDLVVTIKKKTGETIYLSPSLIRGMFRVLGTEAPRAFVESAKKEGKQILKKLLEEI